MVLGLVSGFGFGFVLYFRCCFGPLFGAVNILRIGNGQGFCGCCCFCCFGFDVGFVFCFGVCYCFVLLPVRSIFCAMVMAIAFFFVVAALVLSLLLDRIRLLCRLLLSLSVYFRRAP